MKTPPPPVDLPRRRFVQGTIAGGIALATMPWSQRLAFGAQSAPILSGNHFDLTAERVSVNFTGTTRSATVINGSLPAPTLRWREGETVTIRVTNRLDEMTAIHWHGILLPYEMDGVPGLSFPGIAPGETFEYQFKVRQSGTYWYHAHTLHEQTGLYGAIIIDPAQAPQITTDRDYVVLLSDWTDENPESVLRKLKSRSDYYNFQQPTVTDFFRDVSELGWNAALDKRQMWNQMRMNPRDLSDVSAHTFTYLMNGHTPARNWTGLFKPGERVRLRFVNAGTASFFDVRIPGLSLQVIAADGQDVEPVSVDEFRIAPGETYDVIVTPNEDRAYTLFAQSMDRSGYARGTLAPRLDMTAEVPPLDKAEWLTMDDMMGSMHAPRRRLRKSNGASTQVRHATSEYGPSVDMRVDTPRSNLDDPGIGLRNNGRRVLTYADLHTIGGTMDARRPEREIEMHLTGNMERYAWSIDGLPFSESKPIHFRHGERLRVIFHNDTMMTHPMHLHGLWSEIEDANGNFVARKHTISVQPAQRISIMVTADEKGHWAWHCHLLYHMVIGMFRQVVVA